MADELTLDERRGILQKEINRWVADGYQVSSQTDTAAQLTKKRKFSLLGLLIGLVVFYILWSLFLRKKKIVYIQVDVEGKIETRKN